MLACRRVATANLDWQQNIGERDVSRRPLRRTTTFARRRASDGPPVRRSRRAVRASPDWIACGPSPPGRARGALGARWRRPVVRCPERSSRVRRSSAAAARWLAGVRTRVRSGCTIRPAASAVDVRVVPGLPLYAYQFVSLADLRRRTSAALPGAPPGRPTKRRRSGGRFMRGQTGALRRRISSCPTARRMISRQFPLVGFALLSVWSGGR